MLLDIVTPLEEVPDSEEDNDDQPMDEDLSVPHWNSWKKLSMVNLPHWYSWKNLSMVNHTSLINTHRPTLLFTDHQLKCMVMNLSDSLHLIEQRLSLQDQTSAKNGK